MRPTAQGMAIKFRQRDARLARIREAARVEREADEMREEWLDRRPWVNRPQTNSSGRG